MKSPFRFAVSRKTGCPDVTTKLATGDSDHSTRVIVVECKRRQRLADFIRSPLDIPQRTIRMNPIFHFNGMKQRRLIIHLSTHQTFLCSWEMRSVARSTGHFVCHGSPDATKYSRPHKWRPQCCFCRWWNSISSLRNIFPLIACITLLKEREREWEGTTTAHALSKLLPAESRSPTYGKPLGPSHEAEHPRYPATRLCGTSSPTQ